MKENEIPIEEIRKIFGQDAVDEIGKILFTLEKKIVELKTSRDNWKKKYMDLKEDQK